MLLRDKQPERRERTKDNKGLAGMGSKRSTRTNERRRDNEEKKMKPKPEARSHKMLITS